jgi:anti-sigma factor (TIGR02949 family)
MTDSQLDPCAHCEEMMQPYLDHTLSEDERIEAESHLDGCDWCRRRYHFEESLRIYVRQVVTEPMPVELKQKLSALRIPLS